MFGPMVAEALSGTAAVGILGLLDSLGMRVPTEEVAPGVVIGLLGCVPLWDRSSIAGE